VVIFFINIALTTQLHKKAQQHQYTLGQIVTVLSALLRQIKSVYYNAYLILWSTAMRPCCLGLLVLDTF